MNSTDRPAGWFSQLSEVDFDVLGRVDAGAWVVFQVLRWFARNGATCFPSVEAIGELAHLAPRSVHHALVRLLKADLIDRKTERGKPTVYRLLGCDAGVTPADGRCDAGVSKPMTPVSVTHDAGVSKPMTPVSQEVEREKHEVERENKPRARGAGVVEADRLTAAWMFGLIQTLDAKAKKPDLDKWAGDIRLTRERDGRTEAEIRAVFQWANSDEFWHANILSPAKLRKQFGQLTLKMNGSKHRGNGSTSSDVGSPARVRSGKPMSERYIESKASRAS